MDKKKQMKAIYAPINNRYAGNMPETVDHVLLELEDQLYCETSLAVEV